MTFYSMEGMYSNCDDLTELDLSKLDTSETRSMKSMFYGCTNLRELDLSNFDTSKVSTMESMFADCWNLVRLNLSSFDMTNVTETGDMFRGCGSLREVVLGEKCRDIEKLLPKGVRIIIEPYRNKGSYEDYLYYKCPSVYKKYHTKQECIEYMRAVQIIEEISNE